MKIKTRQFLVIGIVFITVMLIASFTPYLISLGNTIPTKMLLMLLPFTFMVGFVVMVIKMQKIQFFPVLGFNKAHIAKQFYIALPIFATTVFIFVVTPLFLGMSKSDVLRSKITNPSIIAFYIIYYMIFVSMSEEIVFRGYLYEKLKETMNSGIWAVVISSVMFGLFHYPVGRNILQVLVTTVIGLIFGLSRLKIKDCSTLSVGIAHGLHDTFILILSCILM